MPVFLRRTLFVFLNRLNFPVLHEVPGIYAWKRWLCRWCGLRLGSGVVLTAHVHAEPGMAEVTIEEYAMIGLHTVLINFAPISIGKFTRIGTDVTLANGAPGERPEPTSGKTLSIGRGCWIGAGATILGPVTIGDFAIIGAGSLVVGDVPAQAVVFGVPARIIWKRKLPDRIWYLPGCYYDPRTLEFCS